MLIVVIILDFIRGGARTLLIVVIILDYIFGVG